MKRGREVDTENLSEEDKKLKSSYEFWNACGEGNLIRVLEFCVNGIDVNFKETNFHRSCLHHAVEGGHVDVVRVLIHNGADVNAVTKYGFTALHNAANLGCVDSQRRVDIVNMLLQNGADVNVVAESEYTALSIAAWENRRLCILQLLCFGAKIDKEALKRDKTRLLQPMNDRLNSLRAGKGMTTSLLCDEERRFMWNLAFSFTIQHRGAAFKAYYAIRSFITYHGIFMASGYDLGEGSIWNICAEADDQPPWMDDVMHQIRNGTHYNWSNWLK
eukprot:g747.t1